MIQKKYNNPYKWVQETKNIKMESNLLLYATYYHSLGMNIAPIKGRDDIHHGYKRPTDSHWMQYHDEPQTDSYILSQDWNSCSGLGLITGFNQYRAIDIDYLYYDFLYYHVLKSHKEQDLDWWQRSRSFLRKCLNLLGLPEDYPWVTYSGSGFRFHIIFKADDIEGFESNNTAYSPNPNYVERHERWGLLRNFVCMELSWKFFLVLPPSSNYSANQPNLIVK